MATRDGKKVVVSCDGGGVRGLLSLEVLKYLEERLGKPIAQVADTLAGTSTGGFIVLAAGRNQGMTAAQISDFYRAQAPRIFSRTTWQRLTSMATLNGPKYNNQALYEAVIGAVGGTTRMGDAQTNLMVTSYDLKERSPRFISSWGTPEMTMVSAAMRSSAAPTYFVPYENSCDGGVVSNNPALAATIETCRLYDCTVRDVLCISIGTGSDQQPIDADAAKSWGLLSWAQPLLSVFMDGSSTLATYQMQRLLPDANVLRLQCDVRGEMSDLDNTSPQNLANLQKAGKALVATHQKQIDAFLEQLT